MAMLLSATEFPDYGAAPDWCGDLPDLIAGEAATLTDDERWNLLGPVGDAFLAMGEPLGFVVLCRRTTWHNRSEHPAPQTRGKSKG